MVDCQIRTFDVTDRAVLAAMDDVERERFLPASLADLAYADRSIELPLVEGSRTMLPPMVLARLIQALGIEAGARVLDVAGATGYSAALLVRLGAEVTRLESRAPAGVVSAGDASQVRTGPLEAGWPDLAPFDAILINGALDRRPSALLDQLAEGGRLACLHRQDGVGRGVLYVKAGGAVSSRTLFDASAPVLADFAAPAEFRF